MGRELWREVNQGNEGKLIKKPEMLRGPLLLGKAGPRKAALGAMLRHLRVPHVFWTFPIGLALPCHLIQSRANKSRVTFQLQHLFCHSAPHANSACPSNWGAGAAC